MKSDTAKSRKMRAGASSPPAAVKKNSVSQNLTIYEALSLKDVLLALPARATAIELDLSQVIEIDTAGLQLLLLAQRESARQGKTLRLGSCSPAVQELIELFDLAELFGTAQALPAPEAVQA